MWWHAALNTQPTISINVTINKPEDAPQVLYNTARLAHIMNEDELVQKFFTTKKILSIGKGLIIALDRSSPFSFPVIFHDGSEPNEYRDIKDLVRGCDKTKNWLGTTMEALDLIADGTQQGLLSVEGITVRRCNQLLLQCSKL